MGQLPKFRVFISDPDGTQQDLKKRDSDLAFWEVDGKVDKHGNKYYSGKIGKGPRWALMFQVVDQPAQPVDDPARDFGFDVAPTEDAPPTPPGEPDFPF
jgi:hypothetical protein